MSKTCMLVVGAFLLAPTSVDGRLIEKWPYERLFKEAELVVLAEATGSTESGEVVKVKDWSTEFVGVNTKFTVKSVLKGQFADKPLTVFHLKTKPEVLIQNGPLFVEFCHQRRVLKVRGEKAVAESKPAYLLFLKKGKDGRYEPASGRIDPELSVKEVVPPQPAWLFEESLRK